MGREVVEWRVLRVARWNRASWASRTGLSCYGNVHSTEAQKNFTPLLEHPTPVYTIEYSPPFSLFILESYVFDPPKTNAIVQQGWL